MAGRKINLFDRIFKDKDKKIIIWQNPNVPLWGWVLFSILASVFKHGTTHRGFQNLASASLLTWAYLEIRSGESIFRRILGAVIMVSVIYGYLRA